MRPFRVFALSIALACAAAPLPGQVLDRDLSGRSLELDLWGADVRIVLRAGATPRLEAWAVQGKDAAPLAGPAVTFEDEGDVLRVSRAVKSEEVTVRVEVTLEVGHPVRVIGHEMNVAIQGPPLDIEEMKMLRELADEELRELPAPDWSNLSLTLSDSRADVFGISGAWLEGNNSYFVVRQSTNELRVALDGGAVEIDQHRGVLGISGKGEFTARNAVGLYELAVEGGDVELNGAEGQVTGTVTGTALHFFDWRGRVEIESYGGSVEMRAFRPASQQKIEIAADDTEVAIEGLEEGMVDLVQKGGKLVLRDITGKMKVDARLAAEIEMQRLGGSWTTWLQNSELLAEEVEHLAFELYDSKVEVAEVERLEIISRDSEITGSGIRQLGKTSITSSIVSLDLVEGAGGQLFIRSGTQASVVMEPPCIVSVEEEVEIQTGASLDVSGCREGLGPEDLQGDSFGDDSFGSSDRPGHLRVSVGGGATLEVRGRQ